MRHSFSFRQIYGPAMILAAITLYGLFSALLGDGVWDAFSWIALAVPLSVIVLKYSSGRQGRSDR